MTYEWSINEQVSHTSSFKLTGNTSTYLFFRKNNEYLTTSFYQLGKADLTAMDLPVQALRVKVNRVNMRHLSFLSAFVYLLPYIGGLLSQSFAAKEASALYYTGDLASIHFCRKKACNCSLTLPRHQTSTFKLLRPLYCSWLRMDLIPICYKKRFTLSGKRSWWEFNFF